VTQVFTHVSYIQAFQFMSHKFHGRGSGKKKMEKRIKNCNMSMYVNQRMHDSGSSYIVATLATGEY